MAEALWAVTRSDLLAERLRRGALAAAAGRSWEASMRQLGRGYGDALLAGELAMQPPLCAVH